MTSALMIYGSLANYGNVSEESTKASNDLLQDLLNGAPDLPLFRHAPPPSGTSQKGAFDWQGILGTGADLLAFAGLFWAAYERFVKPRLGTRLKGHETVLYIVIEHPNGQRVEFLLGTDYIEKDIFIEQFVRTVAELQAADPAQDDEALLSKYTDIRSYVRITVRQAPQSQADEDGHRNSDE